MTAFTLSCWWCGGSFTARFRKAKLCSYTCSELLRVDRKRFKKQPDLLQKSKQTLLSAKEITWQNIDVLFPQTFIHIERTTS